VTDRYAVIGHPVAHSRSPDIHAAFARATGEDIEYLRLLAPLDGFAATLDAFRAGGGRGANITVPFKEEACRAATRLSDRAEAAGAVNTISFRDGAVWGDNTDGVGLVRDLMQNLGIALAGRRILLLGAGGAARGAVGALLAQQPRSLAIANRTATRAQTLVALFAPAASRDAIALSACGFDALVDGGFDVVVNATSASLAGEAPPLPANIFARDALAYDMMYGKGDTPFMAQARIAGANVADGLGMLVEQAAESFHIWRGVRPETGPVLEALRRSLQ